MFGRRSLILAAIIGTCGCSSQSGPTGVVAPAIAGDLREVGDLIRTARKPPAKATDLQNGKTANPRGYEMVQSGEIVVIWGGTMAGEGDAASGKGPKGVIAYEKKVPAEGGYVLLQDGNIQQMTADEFKTAPKAK